MKKNPFSKKIIGVLASVLAVGSGAPVGPSVSNAAARNAPNTVTRTAPGENQQAAIPAQGSAAIGMPIQYIGGEALITTKPGCDPKTWGMSQACKNMRLGFQPHYRPRAQA